MIESRLLHGKFPRLFFARTKNGQYNLPFITFDLGYEGSREESKTFLITPKGGDYQSFKWELAIPDLGYTDNEQFELITQPGISKLLTNLDPKTLPLTKTKIWFNDNLPKKEYYISLESTREPFTFNKRKRIELFNTIYSEIQMTHRKIKGK